MLKGLAKIRNCKRKLRKRIAINDLTDFEAWALAVIPLLIVIALILGAYLIVWW